MDWAESAWGFPRPLLGPHSCLSAHVPMHASGSFFSPLASCPGTSGSSCLHCLCACSLMVMGAAESATVVASRNTSAVCSTHTSFLSSTRQPESRGPKHRQGGRERLGCQEMCECRQQWAPPEALAPAAGPTQGMLTSSQHSIFHALEMTFHLLLRFRLSENNLGCETVAKLAATLPSVHHLKVLQ